MISIYKNRSNFANIFTPSTNTTTSFFQFLIEFSEKLSLLVPQRHAEQLQLGVG
jgi:hypothetical protein